MIFVLLYMIVLVIVAYPILEMLRNVKLNYVQIKLEPLVKVIVYHINQAVDGLEELHV